MELLDGREPLAWRSAPADDDSTTASVSELDGFVGAPLL